MAVKKGPLEDRHISRLYGVGSDDDGDLVLMIICDEHRVPAYCVVAHLMCCIAASLLQLDDSSVTEYHFKPGLLHHLNMFRFFPHHPKQCLGAGMYVHR